MTARSVRAGPVLIGGASRSGKTLVRWMLASHPRVAVSRRTELWPRFHGRFGDLADPDRLDQCLQALLARDQVAALAPDVGRLRREFRTGPATYARLFGLLHAQYAEREGAARWGDQSAGVERFADEVLAAWPDAAILHLVRDPRDRYVATVDERPGQASLLRTTTAWIRAASRARRNVRRHGDACRILRYEDLASDPVGTAVWLCSWLGERYHPAMPRLTAGTRYADRRSTAPDGIPIHTGEVGRHHRDLAPRDAALITAATAPWMGAFGYAASRPVAHLVGG